MTGSGICGMLAITSLGKLSGSRRCCQLVLEVGEGTVLGQAT